MHYKRKKQDMFMYRNLYAGKRKRRDVKPGYGLTKIFVFCIIAGLMFLTVYENGRIMRKLLSEPSDGSFWGETAKESGERKIRIVLDAGHGGKDTGSFYGGMYEKDIDYMVVRDMQKFLESMGAEVILSRDENDFATEYERIKTANSKKADLFVSIHCGCGREDVGMPGMECYYAGDGSLGMEYADALAEALRQEASIKCSGAGRRDFYVLKNADMPAVLVKLGSLYDPDDRRKLEEASYREQVSRKLAESIMQLFYK